MRGMLLSPIRNREQRFIKMLKYLWDADNLKGTPMVLKIRFSCLKALAPKSSKFTWGQVNGFSIWLTLSPLLDMHTQTTEKDKSGAHIPAHVNVLLLQRQSHLEEQPGHGRSLGLLCERWRVGEGSRSYREPGWKGMGKDAFPSLLASVSLALPACILLLAALNPLFLRPAGSKDVISLVNDLIEMDPTCYYRIYPWRWILRVGQGDESHLPTACNPQGENPWAKQKWRALPSC